MRLCFRSGGGLRHCWEKVGLEGLGEEANSLLPLCLFCLLARSGGLSFSQNSKVLCLKQGSNGEGMLQRGAEFCSGVQATVALLHTSILAEGESGGPRDTRTFLEQQGKTDPKQSESATRES